MSDAEAASFTEKLEAKLVNDSPEQIVGALADLVLMRDQFANLGMYHLLMKVIAGFLLSKTMRLTHD